MTLRTEMLHWDGRLDNRDDLLLRLRDSLQGETSNEAIVSAVYERWGTDGLVHLIGDWSLVLRDRVNRITLYSRAISRACGRFTITYKQDACCGPGGAATISACSPKGKEAALNGARNCRPCEPALTARAPVRWV